MDRQGPPLTEAAFHILLVLADHAWHGYGIMQEIARLTEGRVMIGPGTLYRSLQRLRVERMIEESAEFAGSPAEDERRRTYKLTPVGHEVARAEARRLAALVDAARERGLLDSGHERVRRSPRTHDRREQG